MNGITLEIDTESFSRSSLGVISGVIAIRIGDESFPAIDWDDLIVPVAIAWLEAILRIVGHLSKSERIWFMDGPFWVDLIDSEYDVRLFAVEDRSSGNLIRHDVGVDLHDLLANVANTAGQIIHECRLRGWNDSDLVKLEQLKQQARRARGGIRT